MACRNGQMDTAKWLLEKGPNINKKNPAGETPLDQALGRKHPETARWLDSLGARPSSE
jgi:ankyrin repeat protein